MHGTVVNVDIDENEDLEEALLAPPNKFLDFWGDYLSHRTEDPMEQLVYYLGITVGCLSVAFAIPYGYDLGADNLGLKSELSQQIAGGYLAIVGTAAVCALTGRVTGNAWRAMVTSARETEVVIKKPYQFLSKDTLGIIFLKIIPLIFGTISTIPNIYITEKSIGKFSQALSIPLDFFAILGVATIRSWALSMVLSRFFNDLSRWFFDIKLIRSCMDQTSHYYKKRYVIQHMYTVKSSALALSLEQAQVIVDKLLNDSNMANEAKLELFLKPEAWRCSSLVIPKESWGRFLFKHTGGVLALFWPYSGYEYAKAAVFWFFNIINFSHAQTTHTLAEVIGIIAYLAVAAIAILGNQDTFNKIYSAFSSGLLFLRACVNTHSLGFTKKDMINLLFYIFFAILAMSSTAPKAKVAIDVVEPDAYGLIVIISTIVCAFSSDFWAWNSLREEKFTQPDKKTILIKYIDGFIGKIDSFAPRYIDYLLAIVNPELLTRDRLDTNQTGRDLLSTTTLIGTNSIWEDSALSSADVGDRCLSFDNGC